MSHAHRCVPFRAAEIEVIEIRKKNRLEWFVRCTVIQLHADIAKELTRSSYASWTQSGTSSGGSSHGRAIFGAPLCTSKRNLALCPPDTYSAEHVTIGGEQCGRNSTIIASQDTPDQDQMVSNTRSEQIRAVVGLAVCHGKTVC